MTQSDNTAGSAWKAVLTVQPNTAREPRSARLRGMGCMAVCDHVWLNRAPYAWALALLVAAAVFSSEAGKTSADKGCDSITPGGLCVRDGRTATSSLPSR